MQKERSKNMTTQNSMKLTKTEQLVLDVMGGAEPLSKICYTDEKSPLWKRTARAHKAIQSLKDKGVIYKSEGDHMLYVV
jgi:hypothetical protein